MYITHSLPRGEGGGVKGQKELQVKGGHGNFFVHITFQREFFVHWTKKPTVELFNLRTTVEATSFLDMSVKSRFFTPSFY